MLPSLFISDVTESKSIFRSRFFNSSLCCKLKKISAKIKINESALSGFFSSSKTDDNGNSKLGKIGRMYLKFLFGIKEKKTYVAMNHMRNNFQSIFFLNTYQERQITLKIKMG